MENKKRTIRKQILAERARLSMEERKRAAILLTERLCGHQWFYLSDVLLAFVSYGSEIDTSMIIEEALKRGKKVYVPKVEGDELRFYRMESFAQLQAGYKEIPEPAGDTEEYVYDPTEAGKVLMLMPGAVFDRYRNRCGYGKGFYDRYLTGKEALQLRTIGVGYRCQEVEELPTEAWNIRPYQVICV